MAFRCRQLGELGSIDRERVRVLGLGLLPVRRRGERQQAAVRLHAQAARKRDLREPGPDRTGAGQPDRAARSLVHLTNNVHVTGNLQLQQSSGVRLVGATIDGNLQLNQLSGGVDPSSPGINLICGNTIRGNVQVLNGGASAPANIGGGAGCGNTIGGNLQLLGNAATGNTISGNSINGNLQVQNNTGGDSVSGNIVGGHIQVQNNAGANTVTGNTSDGNLQCQGNGSVTGSGNLAHGNIQGQCTGTKF